MDLQSSIKLLLQGVIIAQNRGAYDLKEASLMHQASETVTYILELDKEDELDQPDQSEQQDQPEQPEQPEQLENPPEQLENPPEQPKIKKKKKEKSKK